MQCDFHSLFRMRMAPASNLSSKVSLYLSNKRWCRQTVEKDWWFSFPHWYDFWLSPLEPRYDGPFTKTERQGWDGMVAPGQSLPSFPGERGLLITRLPLFTGTQLFFYPKQRPSTNYNEVFIFKMEISDCHCQQDTLQSQACATQWEVVPWIMKMVSHLPL